MHDVVAEMRALLDEYDERVMIGEIYLPIERLVAYYGARRPRRAPAVQLPADPRALERARDRAHDRRIRSARCRRGGWPNWVLGNHDQPRIASRVGPQQARVAAMLLLTLRGTPTLYYGDEIGMDDVGSRPTACRTRREERAGPRPRPRSAAHADAVGRLTARRLQRRRSRGSR